jgi:uncharacterized protein
MEWDLFPILLTVGVGFSLGFAIGMTGVGGGALIQPALIHILNISPVDAVGTGLVYAVITKIGGTLSHLKLKTVSKSRAGYLLLGSVPGVLAASQSINYFTQTFDETQVDATLQIFMGIVLLFTAGILILQLIFSRGTAQQAPEALSRRDKLIGVGAGFLIGVLIGATSIGGGVLIIPVLMLFLNSDAKGAVGTSIAVSCLLSLLGGAVYLLHGNIVLATVAFMAIGALVGVFLGSRLTVKISDRWLRIIIIFIVIFSGISLFF